MKLSGMESLQMHRFKLYSIIIHHYNHYYVFIKKHKRRIVEKHSIKEELCVFFYVEEHRHAMLIIPSPISSIPVGLGKNPV